MADAFFLIFLFLFGAFVYGTLAAGATRSIGRMMGWGIFSLLPLTLFWVFSCLFCDPLEQAIPRILCMFVGALSFHVAVSYGIRFFSFRSKKGTHEITELGVMK